MSTYVVSSFYFQSLLTTKGVTATLSAAQNMSRTQNSASILNIYVKICYKDTVVPVKNI